MYRDDENKVEDRTEAEWEEKNEEAQGLASEETEKSDAMNTPEQSPVTAQDNYTQDNYSSSVQPSIDQKQTQNIYGNGQQGGYGNHPYTNQQSSYNPSSGNLSSGYGQQNPAGYPQPNSANGYPSGNTGYQPSGNGGYSSPGNTGYQPSGNSGYSSPGNTGYQPSGNTGYSSPGNAGYQPSGHNGYQPSGNAGYSSSGNTGYQPSGSSNYGRQYAPWQQPQNSFSSDAKKTHAKKPVPPLVKKTAGIVAAALLFGVIAGTTMSGVQMLTKQLNPDTAQEQVSLSQAETLPAPQDSAKDNASQVIVTGTNDVSAIVERAMPSVVAINSVTQKEIQNWFGQSQIYEGRGSGSGIIVGESDTELLLVTNKHVIEGASSLSVSFCDNESADAHIKGTDSENDLAVLAVSLDQISDDTKSKIASATLGDSDALKVGQGVIAIGNALGYGQSVTVGYISALDREVHTDEQTTRNLLQTDAAINPGNSGGALLNMQGELVGINSAKYSSTDVEGMGYAIPISKVSSIIDELMTKKTRVQIERERQGYLGIQGTDIDANTSNLYGMPQGVFVYKIVEGGAAASSDLKEKDIITKFDGQSVKTMAELKDMLIYYAGGDSIELTVQSLKDGEYVERQVTITLGTRPRDENIN